MCNLRTDISTWLQIGVCLLILGKTVLTVSIRRQADYFAPANPCRHEDTFCSVKCEVLQLKGDYQCDFCVCEDKNNYVKWDTETPDPTATSFSSTTLSPDYVRVYGITYHRVSDPCDLTRDGVCPTECTERLQVKQDGANCTMCDCQDAAALLG